MSLQPPSEISVKRKGATYLVDIGILAAAWGLFFWRFFATAQVDRLGFAPGDFTYEHFYSAYYAAQRLASGALPLWQPYAYAGHPFVGDIQRSAFYPFRLLTLLLHASGGLRQQNLELESLLHHLAATIFTYVLARRLTRHRMGGLFSAVAFGFSGYLTGYPILQVNFIEAATWLPLLLWAWDQAGERWALRDWRRAARWVVFAGVILGISLLAGSAQISLYMIYGTLAFAVFRLWTARLHTVRQWAGALAAIAAYVTLGLGIAAVQLVPTLEFIPLSLRAAIGFEESGTGFTTYDWLQVVFPPLGGAFQVLYVGVLVPGLAAVGLTAARRASDLPRVNRQTIAFFGYSGLIAALLSLGKHLSLFTLPYLLAPAWGLFRQQERVVVWAILALALLAGYGAAWLASAWRHQGAGENSVATIPDRGDPEPVHAAVERRLAVGYGAATLAALGLAMAFFVGYQAGKEQLWGFTAASVYLALVLALTYVGLRSRRPWLLLALLALDLFTVNAGRNEKPGPDPADVDPPPALSVPLADTGPFRIANEILPGNYGGLYGLEDINGTSPLVLAQYRQWLEALPVSRSWNLLNVKYVLTWREQLDAPAERVWEGVGADGKPVYTYRLREVGPRARLVGTAIIESDARRAIERTGAASFDPSTQVILPWAPSGYGSAAQCQGTVQWLQRQPENLVLAVTSEDPCILVLSELDYPGWLATVDATPTPILLADGLLRAIAVPAGEHQVVFTFQPASIRIGMVLTLVALIIAIVAFLVAGRRHQPVLPA